MFHKSLIKKMAIKVNLDHVIFTFIWDLIIINLWFESKSYNNNAKKKKHCNQTKNTTKYFCFFLFLFLHLVQWLILGVQVKNWHLICIEMRKCLLKRTSSWCMRLAFTLPFRMRINHNHTFHTSAWRFMEQWKI